MNQPQRHDQQKPPADILKSRYPQSGYQRLRDFEVRRWQLMVLLAIIAAVSIALFPRDMKLVRFYQNRHMYDQAIDAIDRMLWHQKTNPDLLIAKAEILVEKGNIGLAMDILEKTLAVHPGYPLALKRLSDIYLYQLDDPYAAYHLYKKNLDITPDRTGAIEQILKLALHINTNPIKAEAAELAHRYGQSNRVIQKKAADMFLWAERPEDRFRVLKQLAEESGGRPDDVAQMMEAAAMTRQLETIRQAAKIAEKLVSTPEDVLKQEAEAYITAGFYRQAIETYRLYVSKKWEDTQARGRLAELYLWVNEPANAYELFQQLARESEARTELTNRMIETAIATGDAEIIRQAKIISKELLPNDPLLNLTVAEMFLSMGEYPEAIAAYKDYLQLNMLDRGAWKQLTRLYVWTDQYPSAYDTYMKMAGYFPVDVEDVKEIVNLARATGDPVRIAQAKAFALEKFPDNKELKRILAPLYLLVEGDIDTAIENFLDYLNDHPEDVDAMVELAQIYIQTGQPAKAYGVYKHLAIMSGGNGEYVEKMVKLAIHSADSKVIGEAITLAYKLRPNDTQLTLKVAKFYQETGNLKLAVTAYRKYLQTHPDDLAILKQLGRVYLWLERPDLAYDVFRQVAETSNGDPESVEEMIRVAQYTGNPEIILDAVNTAIRLHPENPDYWKRAATILLAVGKSDKALDAYDAYLKIQPTDRDARKQMARIYLWTNRPQDALTVYAQMIVDDPRNPDLLLEAANLAVGLGQLKQGIAYYERLMHLKPNDIQVCRKLAECYGWAGDTRNQMVLLERLLHLGDLTKDELLILAQLYLDHELGNKALEVLKPYEILKKLPLKPGLMLARAHELAGQINLALDIYGRLSEENQNNPDILADLGNRALWLQKTKIAKKFYEAALAIDPKHPAALKGNAQIYAWNNQPDKAIELFEAYNRINPNDYSARYQLAELYYIKNRNRDAFKQYEKTLDLMDVARKRLREMK